jgi:hypothetical protein
MDLDLTKVAATLEGWSCNFIGTDPDAVARLPRHWRAIALATDPGTRRRTTLALWNREFLAVVPQFAQTLHTRLLDVLPCLVDDKPTLIYVTTDYITWIGWDPRGTEKPPPFWDSIPAPLKTFLREVHAGFTAPDGESYGPMQPAYMQTLADLAGCAEGIPDWDEEIPSTRLLRIAKDSGNLEYCVSPDLHLGKVALVYEGDIDPQDFGPEFDDLMTRRYE